MCWACSQDFSKICWRVEICAVVMRPWRKPHWYHTALVPLFSQHLGIYTSWEAKQRDFLVGGSFTPNSFFAYGADQFVNFSVTFQNAMPLDTHESAKPSGVLSSPNPLSNFSQFAWSSDLAAASGSLLMHSTEAFICAKLKHSAWKTLFSSVRWGGNVDIRKAPCWNYCFHNSKWNIAHCIICICWQMLQCGPNSQNFIPSSHCCLTRQPPCFACVLHSAGLTIVANVAIATGPALLVAPRSSVINLIYYIIRKIFFSLRSQSFAKFAISKRRFSIERCLCPEIIVWFFLYYDAKKLLQGNKNCITITSNSMAWWSIMICLCS